MELTGKCKEEFDKWCADTFFMSKKRSVYTKAGIVKLFHEYPFSMRYGAHLEFFDSVGINISVTPYFEGVYTRGFEPTIFRDGEKPITIFFNGDVFTTRFEAQFKAVNKANELFNEQQS